MIQWVVGVTTVPERLGDCLPATLKSIEAAGFPEPRLFIDGVPPATWPHEDRQITLRWPKVRTLGNWALGLAELYLRQPNADRFVMFQDDIILYRNTRQYLDQQPYPEDGYWNLYCVPKNEEAAPGQGFYYSNQLGKGALALVFSKKAVIALFSERTFVERPLNAAKGWRSIDGGIVTALGRQGIKEYVHSPSLVQHVGLKSTMGNVLRPLSKTFRGENFDALELIKK